MDDVTVAYLSAGSYGGTYAQRTSPFEFGSGYRRGSSGSYLDQGVSTPQGGREPPALLAWNLNRTLSKLNYRIHTDAIKAHLIPAVVTAAQAAITYASEADLLNVALFGQTAKQWRDANPNLEGNMRDYATIEQLLVLANMEGMNAEFIHMGLPAERPSKTPQPKSPSARCRSHHSHYALKIKE